MFFSSVRGLGGSSDHPRPASFISRFRALVLSGNVENLLNDNTNIKEAKDIWEPSLASMTELEEDDDRLDFLHSNESLEEVDDEICSLQSTDAQQYVAGYLAQKVCLHCTTPHVNLNPSFAGYNTCFSFLSRILCDKHFVINC